MPFDPAQDDPDGQSTKPRFKYYSEPDRKLIAKRAIAQAEREAEERQDALQERRQQAKVEKLRIMGRLHSRAVRDLKRPRRRARTGRPSRFSLPDLSWPQLAVACCAGLAILAVSISPEDLALPGTQSAVEWVAAPAAGPEPQPENRLFVRPALINLRADASQDSPVLAQMIQGTAVLEVQRDSDWIKVALPEDSATQGWIHSSLLSSEPPADTAQ
jgi:hypothetical protein